MKMNSLLSLMEQHLRAENNHAKFLAFAFSLMASSGMAYSSTSAPSEYFGIQAVSGVMQTQTIKGNVVSDTGEPLIGVSVSVKGANVGTVTDYDGNFEIKAKPGDLLELTYVGFSPLQVKVQNQNQMKLTMKEDTKALDEVVVTGALGIRKQEPKMGYAVSTVKADELIRTNSVNPISSLQGKVAGVSVNVMGSSGVQSSPSITIRGAKSLNSNSQPIFVVDGIVLENQISEVQGADWGSQLKNLNPDDYESITILKGAAATALYGSRGMNGAVVINTKSGGKRKGLGIDVSFTHQFDKVYKNHIELQDEYGMGFWNSFEGGFNENGIIPLTANSWGMKMEGQMVNVPWSTQKVAFTPQKDNWKALYQTGHYNNTNVALNGGSDNMNYRISYSNTNSVGVLPNNGMNRNALSIKAAGKMNDIFSVETGFQFSRSDVKNAASQGRWFNTSNFGRAITYSIPRSFDVAAWKQNYRNDDNSLKQYADYSLFNEVGEMFHRMDYRNEKRTEDSYLANIQIMAQVLPWLDFSAKANYSYYKIFGELKEWGAGKELAGGSYAQNGSNSNQYNFLFSAHANKKFFDDRFEVDGRILSEIYGNGQNDWWRKATNGGLLVPGFFSFTNSVGEVRPEAGAGFPSTRVVGVAGVLNLSWMDQVNLELTGRNDWASSLLYPKINPYGKNNYSIFYPSANVSWIASETFHDALPTWISFGKVRASISRVGYGTSAYATNSTWGYWQGSIYDEDGNAITTGGVQGLDKLQNFNIKPEIQQEIELGLDVRFLNNRIGFDFAYYKKNTYNQILYIPTTAESGATEQWINAGDIQNQGIELLVDGRPIQTRNFKWDMSFNITRNRGKINKFHDGVTEYCLMGDYEGAQVWATEGGEFGVMTATSVRGKFQAYDDAGNKIAHPNNGKHVISLASDKKTYSHVSEGTLYNRWRTDYDKVNETEAYKRTKLGSVQPKFFFGHTQTFSYKNFDANLQIDGRVGGVMYSSSYALGMSRGNLKESLRFRDAASGGVERLGSDGNKYFNGVIPDVIFDQNTTVVSDLTGQNIDLSGMSFEDAVNAGHLSPVHVGAYYQSTYGWAKNLDTSTFDNTWIALREVSLGYTLPKKWVNKAYVQNLRLGFTARNLCYIYNGLKGKLNPEAIQSNNILMPVEYGGTPYSRNFSFNVSLTL